MDCQPPGAIVVTVTRRCLNGRALPARGPWHPVEYGAPATEFAGNQSMEKIIKVAVDRGASDLHIKAGDVFRARIDGRLVALTKQALTPDQTKAIALRLIQNEEVRQRIDQILDYDCSWGAAGIGRFRVNILRQRSSFMIVMRVIPFTIPTVESLRLPPVIMQLAEAERGMILVTGVTGSGKSSSLAAMVQAINSTMHKHIVTLEQPIEFLHRDINSSVTQREVGIDTDSFRDGLKAALRQDPDVVLIGEMRDAETIDTALKAAETGHLLLSTLHTPDAVTTIMRIIAMFPPEEQDVVRIRIAESLNAVISQRLLPRKDGNGRVVAVEVMVVTPAIRDLILEARIGEIRDFIKDGREQYHMQTFDQHLVDLVNADVVSFEIAKAASTRPADFELEMRVLSGGAPESTNGNHDNDAGIPGLVPTALSELDPEPHQPRGKRR
jgi:twitching motility protein PilT